MKVITPLLFVLGLCITSSGFSQFGYLLDSTVVSKPSTGAPDKITYYSYDEQNRLVTVVLNQEKHVYSYPSENTTEIIYFEDGIPLEKTINVYNEAALLESETSYEYVDGTAIESKADTNWYDGSNNLIKTHTWEYEADKKYLSKTVDQIFEGDNLVREVTSTFSLDDTIGTIEIDYLFSDTGLYLGFDRAGDFSPSQSFSTSRSYYENDQLDSIHFVHTIDGEWNLESYALIDEIDNRYSYLSHRKTEIEENFKAKLGYDDWQNSINPFIGSDSIKVYIYDEEEIESLYTVDIYEVEEPTEETLIVSEYSTRPTDLPGYIVIEKDYYHKIPDPVGTKLEKSLSEIRLFPNPIQEDQILQISNPDESANELRMYNSTGQLIMIKKVTGDQIFIVTPRMPGLYFLQLHNEMGPTSVMKKILIR